MKPNNAIFWSTTAVALGGNVTVLEDKSNVAFKSAAVIVPSFIFALVTAFEPKSAAATPQFAILSLLTALSVIPFDVTFVSGI